MKAMKFSWVHGTQQVEFYNSLEEAIYSAIYGAEYGTESLHHIEHGGRLITNQSMEYLALEDQIEQKRKDEEKRQPKNTHILWVKNAKDEWCMWTATSEEELPRLKRALVMDVDESRIKVTKVRR